MVDALALRSYLRGEADGEHKEVPAEGLYDGLFKDHNVPKIFVGEHAFLQAQNDFGQDDIANYFTQGFKEDDCLDHRVRPMTPEYLTSLQQQATAILSLQASYALQKENTSPRKNLDSQNQLVSELD